MELNVTKSLTDLLAIPVYTRNGVVFERYWSPGSKKPPMALAKEVLFNYRTFEHKLSKWQPVHVGTVRQDFYSMYVDNVIKKDTTYFKLDGIYFVQISDTLVQSVSEHCNSRPYVSRDTLLKFAALLKTLGLTLRDDRL